MRKLNFLRLFIFSSSFRFWLMHTLFYAMKTHDTAYGDGASDVILFEGRYSEKIFTNEYLETFNKEKVNYRIPISALADAIEKYLATEKAINNDIKEMRQSADDIIEEGK